MSKRNYVIAAAAFVLLTSGYFIVRKGDEIKGSDILTSVKRGQFRVEIETSGELEAKNSVKILGPQQLRNFQIWQVTIQSIVDEGTVVKKGGWIATLDRSEFQKKYVDKQIELEKANSKFTQTQFDTTITLRQPRTEL